MNGNQSDLPQVKGYRIVRRIGRGGMGVVYEAEDTSTNKRVAIKMIQAGDQADWEDFERFRREAAVLAQLRHSNIVGIIATGEDRRLPYIVMEYMEGGSLAERLKNNHLPSPHMAAQAVESVARALARVHGHQLEIVHRDIKPANILMDKQGTIFKVTDFGLAKRIQSDDSPLTERGRIVGSRGFFAPEQATEFYGTVTTKSDIFSLGVTFYVLLTGKMPFEDPNYLILLQNVISGDPLPPSHHNANIPPELERICLAALRKHPDSRPTAAEMAADLGRFLKRGKP